MDRTAAIEAAILRLTPEGFDADGKPSVTVLNHHIWALDGFEPITATERDELWAERVAEAKDAAEPVDPDWPKNPAAEPEGFTKIIITAAMSDPVPLYVHGVGSWSISVGEHVTLPDEALDALRNSDCTFTQE